MFNRHIHIEEYSLITNTSFVKVFYVIVSYNCLCEAVVDSYETKCDLPLDVYKPLIFGIR